MNYREHECTLLQTPPISLYGNKGSSTDTVCHRDYGTLMKYTNCCAQLHVETKGYILSQLWPKSMSLVCFFLYIYKEGFLWTWLILQPRKVSFKKDVIVQFLVIAYLVLFIFTQHVIQPPSSITGFKLLTFYIHKVNGWGDQKHFQYQRTYQIFKQLKNSPVDIIIQQTYPTLHYRFLATIYDRGLHWDPAQLLVRKNSCKFQEGLLRVENS